jgi:hypothetical protein
MYSPIFFIPIVSLIASLTLSFFSYGSNKSETGCGKHYGNGKQESTTLYQYCNSNASAEEKSK